MSGGSYGYLGVCPDTQKVSSMQDYLKKMYTRLAGMRKEDNSGNRYPMLSNDTGRIIKLIANLDRRVEMLARAWTAVEWCDSGDWGDEQMHSILEEEEKKMIDRSWSQP